MKRSAPAVVNIYATTIVQDRVSPFAADPFFEDFFSNFGPATPRVQNSLGSGVIVAADGLVVSNYHVVGGATEIRVVLSDRREFDATVVLSDEETDLAILRLKGASGLPTLPLRDSDTVEVGELVWHRETRSGWARRVLGHRLGACALQPAGGQRAWLLHPDRCRDQPGNSGGALVDTAGRLVGINTAILSKTGGSLGIGFAIPANLVSG